MNLQDLPQVDALSRSALLAEFPERVRILAARGAISVVREALLGGKRARSAEQVAVELARGITSASLRPVINASGVILHTGLGRARLAPEAVAQVLAVAENHSSVELDLDSGKRGDRQAHVRRMWTE